MSTVDVDVSIVIAAWNARAFLPGAVDSALAQRRVEVEVIVVDDGSTDETAAWVEAHTDQRVVCHRLSRNVGPGGARNAGFDRARGRWIAVLDADDAMLPDRLSRMVRLGEKTGADIVVDNLLLQRDGETLRPMFAPTRFRSGERLDLLEFMEGNEPLRGDYNLGYLKPIFSRAFLRRHGLAYDPSLRIGEDYMLLADCLAAGAVCVREADAGYLYRVRTGSASHRLGSDALDAIRRADERFARRWTLPPPARRVLRRRSVKLARIAAFTASVEAIKAGHWVLALTATLREPRAAAYFRYPLAARARRVWKALAGC